MSGTTAARFRQHRLQSIFQHPLRTRAARTLAALALALPLAGQALPLDDADCGITSSCFDAQGSGAEVALAPIVPTLAFGELEPDRDNYQLLAQTEIRMPPQLFDNPTDLASTGRASQLPHLALYVGDADAVAEPGTALLLGLGLLGLIWMRRRT
jgi:hypothetical protein